MSAELIVYAVIAVGLVIWLRSILGTRTGDERERPNPLMPQQADTPVRKIQGESQAFLTSEAQPVEDRIAALTKNSGNRLSIESDRAAGGLMQISRTDRSFDINAFLQAAQDAFVIIVEAFAQGDRDTLKNLLAQPVYDSFDKALTEREKRGEKVTTDIHAVRRTAVTDAKIEHGQMAYITLRFTADETCVIRDAGDNVLSGNPDRVTEMIDVWTFGRDLRSRDPRWLVCETRDGPEEDHKTPLPEAGAAS